MEHDDESRDICAELGEIIYRLSSTLRRQTVEYRRLLMVLDAVRSGEVDPRRVAIDLAALSWSVVPEGQEADADQGPD
jgi:hypothetical protein